jgi:hypothetical protein
MIQDKQKDLVRALAESYVIPTTEGQVDDFVQGKGQGLNILLQYSFTVISFYVRILTMTPSGPPGVGKTLTTEGLAEHLKMALYVVCGCCCGRNSLAWGYAE